MPWNPIADLKGYGLANPRAVNGRLVIDTYDGNTKTGELDAGPLPLGPMPVLGFAVNTLAAGAQATVTATAVAGGYNLTIGIPRGDTGSASAAIVDASATATGSTWPSQRIAENARQAMNIIPNGALEWGRADDWSSGLTYQTTDVPAGLTAAVQGPASQTTKTSTATSFAVDTSRTYEISFWLKADKPNSRLVIEMLDQSNQNAILSGTIGSTSTNYILFGPVGGIATTWTRHSAVVTFKPEVRTARIGSIFWNHSSGTEFTAVQQIAGLRMTPLPVGHTHAAGDVTGGEFAPARLPSATTAAKGAVTLATQQEVLTGTDTAKALTSAVLRGALDAQRQAKTLRPQAVFVGSSNVVGPNANMWTTKLCSVMGWTEQNFAIAGSRYTLANNFRAQLGTAAASASFVNADVGFVFIADASNNARVYDETAQQVYTAVHAAALDAYSYAKSTFPNARIIVVPMIWPADTVKYAPAVTGGYRDTWVPIMHSANAAQRDAALVHGVEFVEHSWTWLTGNDAAMTAEGDVHPNGTGNTIIARWLQAYLNGGSTLPVTPWVDCEILDGAYYSLGGTWAGPLRARREGWRVRLKGAVKATNSTSANSNFARVPYGLRPEFGHMTIATIEATGVILGCEIHQQGLVRPRLALTGANAIVVDTLYDIG